MDAPTMSLWSSESLQPVLRLVTWTLEHGSTKLGRNTFFIWNAILATPLHRHVLWVWELTQDPRKLQLDGLKRWHLHWCHDQGSAPKWKSSSGNVEVYWIWGNNEWKRCYEATSWSRIDVVVREFLDRSEGHPRLGWFIGLQKAVDFPT